MFAGSSLVVAVLDCLWATAPHTAELFQPNHTVLANQRETKGSARTMVFSHRRTIRRRWRNEKNQRLLSAASLLVVATDPESVVRAD